MADNFNISDQPGGGGGAVASVFGRVGAVVAAAADYAASLISNDSGITGAFVDDALNTLGVAILLNTAAACQARRTTAFSPTTSFGDISLDSTDVEKNAAVIDHEAGTPDRITFVVGGTFEIHYHFDINAPDPTDTAEIQSRVTVNDVAAALDGSEGQSTSFDDSSIDGDQMTTQVSVTFERDFTAADFISLQALKVDVGGTPVVALRAGSIVMTAKRIT